MNNTPHDIHDHMMLSSPKIHECDRPCIGLKIRQGILLGSEKAHAAHHGERALGSTKVDGGVEVLCKIIVILLREP